MASGDEKTFSTSTEQFDMSNLRARNVPDVPEDIDYLMEHLNDPNLDLRQRPPSFVSIEDKKTFKFDDTESQISDRYATSRAESRNSTAIDFDEYAASPYCSSKHLIISSANLLIPKSAPP